MADLFTQADAVISECGKYRYRLSRTWGQGEKHIVWAMCNPSTANASEDDPTIRRCCAFARKWGYGGIVVVNIFALRATDPAELRKTADSVGPDNGRHIREACECRNVVAAWGAHGAYLDRGRAVRRLLSEAHAAVLCLGTTNQGQPRHPLYVRGDTELVAFGTP